jgi:tetratricopeptide (TPR) repeat protein
LRVKIVDFGVAKITARQDDGVETTGLTRSGSMLGSPLYMAPEQARGSKSIDHRADLWSLGVVLYRALAGRAPHQHTEALGELIIAICSEPAGAVQELAPWVPPGVASLVHRALRIEAGERFQSAAEMLEAIERLLPAGAEIDPAMIRPVSDDDRAHVAPRSPEPPARPAAEDAGPELPAGSGERSRADAKTSAEGGGARPPRSRAARRPMLLGAAAAILGTGAAFGLVQMLAPAPPAVETRPLAAAPAASEQRGAPITELPRPVSSSPEALRAYLAGLQNLRDGMMEAGLGSFTRATELDPTLAAAHLHLAVWAFIFNPSTGRKHFQQASRHRGNLSSRDQAFLEAMQPAIQRDPSDWAGTARNLEAMAERFPGDADLHVWLHCSYELDGRLPESMRALDRAIVADPRYCLPWNAKGEQLLYQGDFDGGMAALDQCLAISPSSAYCMQEELWLLVQVGDAGGYEAKARRWIAADPDNPGGYEHLAQRVLWLHGHAAVTDSAAEARAALDLLSRTTERPAIPPFRPLTALEGGVGRTYLLAGRVPEAIEWLRAATASCAALEFPFEHTSAHLWLGQALEAGGESQAACAAYRIVLDRWGKARPRSTTAEQARERSKALGCAG